MIVGALLNSGHFPLGLRPGDSVLVVPLVPTTQAALLAKQAAGGAKPIRATVAGVESVRDSGGNIAVSLAVAPELAPSVATAGAEGRLSVMRELVALTSMKHSPGVTTAALAFTTAWSADHEVIAVEADPAGGDLAARMHLPFEPGLVSLAAAARHGTVSGGGGHAHLQALLSGGSVLVGPGSAELATSALRELRPGTLAGLAGGGGFVVADCGRWSPGSPAQPVIAAADLVLVVTRPTLEGVVHIRSRTAAIRREGRDRLALLLVGEHPYRAAEVGEAVGLRVAGALADDPRGAAALYQFPRPGLARRFLLVRSARSCLEEKRVKNRNVDVLGSGPPVESRTFRLTRLVSNVVQR